MTTETNVVERIICRRLLGALLTAGFLVAVNDGEETTTDYGTDFDTRWKAMFSTDGDYLFVRFRDDPNDERPDAYVILIYGNGFDVISDHTTNLNAVLKPIQDAIERLEENPDTYRDFIGAA